MDVPALRAKTKQPGSLRETLFLCASAPLRLRVYFFIKAAFSKLCNLSDASCISSAAPLAALLSKNYPGLFCVFFL
jgi:hypothetical protein